MLINITKEQLSALEMLSSIGDYYIDDMEPTNSQYEDDKETITQAQDVIQQIQQQFLPKNGANTLKVMDNLYDVLMENTNSIDFSFLDMFPETWYDNATKTIHLAKNEGVALFKLKIERA